uniref:site-specific DNA-methyltransferase (adenine-specific) n=1 Tax=Bacteriophage sp. TaxID=38018 RepID=A0A8D9UHH3_9VIRU|nr:MAG TPA: DNA adenine methylase [Bacteriophage sp.]
MANQLRSPLSGWIGGKSRIAREIIARIPCHDCYVEPFAGAAWVFLKKPVSKIEIINDINRDIVTLYRVIQHHLEEFIRYFKWVLVSRDEFERMNKVNPDTLTDIQRASRFYYIQQLAYNGRIAGNPSISISHWTKPRLNLLRIEEQLSDVHLRLSRVYIENIPYEKLISAHDSAKTFFYIDPPYWGRENYYGKGIFSNSDYAVMAEQLSQIKGKFILSLNDTAGVRETFSQFQFEPIEITYTCTTGKNKRQTEVLITNF